MKYTKEQRLDIARHVYDEDLTVEEAAVKYELNPSSMNSSVRGGGYRGAASTIGSIHLHIRQNVQKHCSTI